MKSELYQKILYQSYMKSEYWCKKWCHFFSQQKYCFSPLFLPILFLHYLTVSVSLHEFTGHFSLQHFTGGGGVLHHFS